MYAIKLIFSLSTVKVQPSTVNSQKPKTTYLYTMKYFVSDIFLTGTDGELLEPATDILKTFLADIGFEAFQDDTDSAMTESGAVLHDYRKEHPFAPFTCFSAYIQQQFFSEEQLQEVIQTFPFEGVNIYYNVREAEDKNWNEAWEQEQGQSDICQQLGITIDVKQAFGTGGHNTTRMIVAALQEENLQGKIVLDCGCGSGILSIAALKLQAQKAIGYDIDEWSVNNTRHNAQLNGISDEQITVLFGDASVLATVNEQFDYILANINRNILLDDMPAFRSKMKPGSCLILSGFYTEDIPLLVEKAESLGLKLQKTKEDDNWACLVFGS